MVNTPSGERLHIGLFGRRNAGKSSILNALSRQNAALVSPTPGTTTDPVQRPMELLPLGPVVLVDTAGLDDEGDLGRMRVKRSLAVLDRTDLAVLVIDVNTDPGEFEDRLVQELKDRKIPTVGAVNKADLDPEGAARKAEALRARYGFPFVPCRAAEGSQGVAELRRAVVAAAPVSGAEVPLVRDLIEPGSLVVLVVPVDTGAPKGRLILPQVQAIRDVLDGSAITVVAKETELAQALDSLGRLPDLVVTDSQAFDFVARTVPLEVPLTSFSILMARYKGDLEELVRGAEAIDALKPGDRVLIAETCTHHQQPDDIGTVKIPRWLRQRVGEVQIEWAHGREMPEDLDRYQLIVHCGGCMINRQLMMSRIRKAQAAGVPIVNYGVFIAHVHGILPRALSPFVRKEAMVR